MGWRVKERREELRLSQEELAAKSGVSRQTISMIETDAGKNVSSRTLVKLAAALDTTVSALFFEGSA